MSIVVYERDYDRTIFEVIKNICKLQGNMGYANVPILNDNGGLIRYDTCFCPDYDENDPYMRIIVNDFMNNRLHVVKSKKSFGTSKPKKRVYRKSRTPAKRKRLSRL